MDESYPSRFVEHHRVQFAVLYAVEPFWAFFDFTWSRVRRNRAQGIRTRVNGAKTYKVRFSYLNVHPRPEAYPFGSIQGLNVSAYVLRLSSFALLHSHPWTGPTSWMPVLGHSTRASVLGAISLSLIIV